MLFFLFLVPSATSSTQLAMYEFLGKIFGVVLHTKFTLNLDLPSVVWKPLVGQQLDLGDLRAIDAMCVQSLEALRNIDKQVSYHRCFPSLPTLLLSPLLFPLPLPPLSPLVSSPISFLICLTNRE